MFKWITQSKEIIIAVYSENYTKLVNRPNLLAKCRVAEIQEVYIATTVP